MKKILLIFCLTILLSDFISAGNYLRVRNPDSWGSSQGTIEEAVVSIRPKGVYMEVGLYLTFSAKGTYYNSDDSLEVEFDFELPEHSIVTDSWLWIGEDIIKGELMDKWTASEIYEDIVDRRRDPSILFKLYNNNYELRIYPMAAKKSRKVKLTYLVPTQWTSTEVMASLPTELLQASKYSVEKFHLLTFPKDEWQNPRLVEYPEIEFKAGFDEEKGNFLKAEIPSEAIQNHVNIAFDSPMQSGLYVNKFKQYDKGYYQLAFLPSQALNLSTSTRVAVLIDFDESNTNVTTDEILNNVKSLLHSNLNRDDYFNLIFSNIDISRASDQWLPADSSTIEDVFYNLDEDPIASYSNLPSLLSNGINFIKDSEEEGTIILVSSSDQVGTKEVGNKLIEDVMRINDSKIPIHVADYQNRNYQYFYIGGRSYYGNEYFYRNITRLTSANFFSIRNGLTFSNLLSKTFNSVYGFMSSFDLYTTLEDGFCYSRYEIDNNDNSTYLDRPILQVGRFQGSSSFKVEAAGEYESEVFSSTHTIPPDETNEGDSVSEQVWIGKYIEHLENQSQSNQIIDEIISYSIQGRVLSKYSAFLCLEPNQGGEICYDCYDESDIIISVEEEETKNDTLFEAFPNPFNSQVKINIGLPDKEIDDNNTFKIYNILGQVVRTFRASNDGMNNTYRFVWNGKNDSGASVSSGTYIFVATTPKNNYSMKLIYMK